jgi:uncharacterized protein YceK
MRNLLAIALCILAAGCASVERQGTIQTPPVEYVR